MLSKHQEVSVAINMVTQAKQLSKSNEQSKVSGNEGLSWTETPVEPWTKALIFPVLSAKWTMCCVVQNLPSGQKEILFPQLHHQGTALVCHPLQVFPQAEEPPCQYTCPLAKDRLHPMTGWCWGKKACTLKLTRGAKEGRARQGVLSTLVQASEAVFYLSGAQQPLPRPPPLGKGSNKETKEEREKAASCPASIKGLKDKVLRRLRPGSFAAPHEGSGALARGTRG